MKIRKSVAVDVILDRLELDCIAEVISDGDKALYGTISDKCLDLVVDLNRGEVEVPLDQNYKDILRDTIEGSTWACRHYHGASMGAEDKQQWRKSIRQLRSAKKLVEKLIGEEISESNLPVW
jgi:hypothetical protein